LLAGVDVRHVDLDHGQPASFGGVAERVGGVRQRPRVGYDRVEPLGAGAVQPSDQLAFVVGLTPRELVPQPGAALGHLGHDLLEGLGAVPFGLPASERPQVRSEQEQHPHPQPPIACAPEPVRSSVVRSSSSGTAPSTKGRPTSCRSTKRAPPRYFLSIRMAERISSAGGSPPSVSSPRDASNRTWRAARPDGPRPRASDSRAANTIPAEIASPWVRPANASRRSSAWPSVWP